MSDPDVSYDVGVTGEDVYVGVHIEGNEFTISMPPQEAVKFASDIQEAAELANREG